MSQTHADQMKTISEIPALLQDQLTRELKDQLKETLDEQLRDRISELLQTQAAEQASFLGNIMDHLELRDVEHQERVTDWTHYQTSMWQKQAREMEGQRAALDAQRLKMELLSETVSETTQNMQPLVGLQSLIKVATEGYTWITFLFHFLGTFNVIWVITRPERCHPFRSYLYGLVFGEALLEFVLTTAVHYELLSEAGRIACVTDLRRWALLVECITYVFGLVSSCLFEGAKPLDGDRASVVAYYSSTELEHVDDEHCGSYADRHRAVYPPPQQHEHHRTIMDRHHDHGPVDKSSSYGEHRSPPPAGGTSVLLHTPFQKPGSEAAGRDRRHRDDYARSELISPISGKDHGSRHESASSSKYEAPRNLTVFHHQPPQVVQGRKQHTTARAHYSKAPPNPSHEPRPTMLFPQRYARSKLQQDKDELASNTPPVEAFISPPPSHDTLQRGDKEAEVLATDIDITPMDEEEESHGAPEPSASATSKRSMMASPEEEPSPKKVALSTDSKDC